MSRRAPLHAPAEPHDSGFLHGFLLASRTRGAGTERKKHAPAFVVQIRRRCAHGRIRRCEHPFQAKTRELLKRATTCSFARRAPCSEAGTRFGQTRYYCDSSPRRCIDDVARASRPRTLACSAAHACSACSHVHDPRVPSAGRDVVASRALTSHQPRIASSSERSGAPRHPRGARCPHGSGRPRRLHARCVKHCRVKHCRGTFPERQPVFAASCFPTGGAA